MTEAPDKLVTALRQSAVQQGLQLPEMPRDASPVQVAQQAGLDEVSLSRALADTIGMEVVSDLASRPVSADFVEKIPIAFARRHGMLGLASDNGHLPVAVSDLRDPQQLEILSRFLGRPVRPVLATAEQIATAVNLAYQQRTGQAQTLIEKLDRRDVLSELQKLQGREDLLDVASRAPVIKLVNLILFEAVKALASDVHIQPYEQQLMVRMRIDGILYDSFDIPKAIQEEVVSRIKVMARMNIAEKRLAQDGRATVQVGDRMIDLRISTVPTSFGERTVIRLLDKSARLYSLYELGMDSMTLVRFRELIGSDHGIILVTGPTGSGKTTTLYAALQEINGKEHNILTLEDPIEYGLEGISQIQVSDKKGMTFASGLRSVLRQDPDVIMVGEIRDRETAAMAIQSALTGHLVFSTLHTNDAASAITRLLDLGIEPYLLASSVVGVLAQRLVRRICPQCSQVDRPTPQELQRLELNPLTADTASCRRGTGCPACRKTGYSGRLGIFELLVVTEAVRRLVSSCATASQIKAQAAEQGMRTLRDDGVGKIMAGTTTIDEVVRVTMRATI